MSKRGIERERWNEGERGDRGIEGGGEGEVGTS